jgi:hypothetical protein
MGPIRNPNWSTSGMRVTLSYLHLVMHNSFFLRYNINVCLIKRYATQWYNEESFFLGGNFYLQVVYDNIILERFEFDGDFAH